MKYTVLQLLLLIQICFSALTVIFGIPFVLDPVSRGIALPLALSFGVLVSSYIIQLFITNDQTVQIRMVLFIALLSIAFIVIHIAGNGTNKSVVEAQEITEAQEEPVEVGIERGNDYIESSQLVEPESIIEELEAIFTDEPEDQDIATETFERVISGEPEEEILEGLAPTVKVVEGRWNCENIGCTFSRNGTVWTISNLNVWSVTILNVIILATLFSVFHPYQLYIPR